MKADAKKTVLLIEAILFWAVALPAASVFFTIAALWKNIDDLGSREQLVRWGSASRLPPGGSS